jgi:hypothetical protein
MLVSRARNVLVKPLGADKGIGGDEEVNALVAEIIDMLNRGERVYLHCRYH